MLYTIVISDIKDETKVQFTSIEGYDFHFKKVNKLTQQDYDNAEVIVGNPSLELVSKCPKLKWIQTDSAGVNGYQNLPEGITLSNAFGAYGPGIAEYMLACVLSSDRKLPEYQNKQLENLWQEEPFGKGISQMKVLSIGMGSIGSSFLKLMHTLGAACYGIRRTVKDVPEYVDQMYTMEELENILPEMDVVALSLPETPSTINLMDEARLSKMKDGSILINVGRGTAIDETALVKLARTNKYLGVWLDVTAHEPLPKNNPLWTAPSVHITPHISGRFTNPLNYQNVCNVILENLKRYTNNEPLIHTVDKTAGY